MYKIAFCFLLTVCFPGSLVIPDKNVIAVSDPALSVLKREVIRDILAERLNDDQVMEIGNKLKPDGSWADIDYADKTRGGWPVNDHLVRLKNMAIIYTRENSKWKENRDLKNKIIAGLDFWLKNDFICPNWWYPEIGVPKTLGPAMILMEESLTPEQKAAGIKILNRAKIGMTGQNKVWLSGNVIYRSLLTDDVEQVKAAVQAIEGEITVSEGEGIQADNSFHQHGPQQQFGNYGSAFAEDMLKWGTIFQPTAFKFEERKVEMLRNYLLNGMRWIVWNDKMDISACGRQLFPNAQSGKASSIKNIFAGMPRIDPAKKDDYLHALNSFDGDKHFWRSDMTVHRRNGFYTSVKMSSTRVAGAESCNEENIGGYHLGDGATYFYQSNEEYTDIFPFWDWKRIPGTTTFHDEAPLPILPCSGYRIQSDFVGGVSDGSNGLATMAYNRDSLHAQKSWFFFDDAVICLGAGISSLEEKEVNTSINQSFLHGPVISKENSAPQPMQQGMHHITNVSWLLHDNWGYFFPERSTVEVANQEQSGDWHEVLRRMPAKELKADLFTLWINHGKQPSNARYAYYVFPSATQTNIAPRAAAIRLLANTASLQAVENIQKNMAGLVFVSPGRVTTQTAGAISVDEPCVVLIKKAGQLIQLSLSDPTHLKRHLRFQVSGNKKIKGINSEFDAKNNVTSFIINLPEKGEAGKSVAFAIQ